MNTNASSIPEGVWQDVRNISVQIRTPDNKAIAGTGVVVSSGGLIATCVHVLKAALGSVPTLHSKVGVVFPCASEEERKRTALICHLCEGSDDDIALLQVQGSLALTEEEVAVLGDAGSSRGSDFRSYGYQRLARYDCGYASGHIEGPVESPEGSHLQQEMIEIKSKDVAKGMSGAAVLDTRRNLVVGLIAERYVPVEVADPQEVAWAVNTKILALPPFGLPIRKEPLTARPARQPEVDPSRVPSRGGTLQAPLLQGVPPLADPWCGRQDLLTRLATDWRSSSSRVVALVGFEGSGKSTLARAWIEQEIGGKEGAIRPDGVFWWSFQDRPDPDAFFQEALRFLGNGRIDPAPLQGNERAHVAAAALATGRTIFVLDGLDALQQSEEDDPGVLASDDLREFLRLFASRPSSSFCLITSRFPVVELVAYPGYRQQEVDRLTSSEGVDLLRRLKVQGTGETLEKLVETWEGHALTLVLLAGYMAQQGSVEDGLKGLPAPQLNESRYDRLSKLLDSYDACLTEDERDFMRIASLFRLPIARDAFTEVFRSPMTPGGKREQRVKRPNQKARHRGPNSRLISMGEETFAGVVDDLVRKQLVRHDPANDSFELHPVVRMHWEKSFPKEGDIRRLHRRIAGYYRERADSVQRPARFEDLKPWIEVLHHCAQAGDFRQALDVYRSQILCGERFALTNELGAYETALALLREFFPDGDLTRECLLPPSLAPQRIIREAAFTLMILGRSDQAISLYRRVLWKETEWTGLSLAHQDLCRLQAARGRLDQAERSAAEALCLAERIQSARPQRNALALRGWLRDLRGEPGAAEDFRQAEALACEAQPDRPYLTGLWGALFTRHLLLTGEGERARRLAESNLEACSGEIYNLSRFHRLLGDLDAKEKKTAEARKHNDAAVQLARQTSDRMTLTEALLGRGRFLVTSGDLGAARRDLEEALESSRRSGYRLYETDCRLAMARLYLAGRNPESACSEVEEAQRLSAAMGYAQGVREAEDILTALHPESVSLVSV